jgi:uncharacterized membrane protein YphA (DoxX/SURF4 family)
MDRESVMNIALWILQVMLGAAFVVHAFLMLRPSPQTAEQGMRYVLEMPRGLRRFAGTAEGLAGIALVIPPLVHVLAWLTPLAAAGLVLLMIGAAIFHLPRREYPNIGLNAVLGLLTAVVAWGRFGPYHF